jgi:hypothetical protein
MTQEDTKESLPLRGKKCPMLPGKPKKRKGAV